MSAEGKKYSFDHVTRCELEQFTSLTNACVQRFVQIKSTFATTFEAAGQIDAILIAGARIPINGALIDVYAQLRRYCFYRKEKFEEKKRQQNWQMFVCNYNQAKEYVDKTTATHRHIGRLAADSPSCMSMVCV